jgi:tetratricopeptide (TPR) repeat protein
MRARPTPAPSQRESFERSWAIVVVAFAAAFLFAVSFDDGGYTFASRGMWAIAVWWAIALGAAAGWIRPSRFGLSTLIVAGLLAALALVTLASAGWAANAARAFSEFDRVTLYLGVFVLVSAAAPRAALRHWTDAIAIALCGVAAVALVSRFLPDTISDRGLSESFPAAATRLNYPVGYWNGLAILVALAVPLLLQRAAAPGHAVLRALAAAPIPALAATMYLASSRGGFATAAIGATAFLLLGRNRWSIACSIAAGAAGSAIVLLYLAQHPTVTNDPLAAGGAERLEAALVVVLGCLAAAAVQAGLAHLLGDRLVPRRFGIAAVAAALALATVAVTAADPAERLSEFKEPPAAASSTDDPILSHLASFGGSGRWQFWESSLDAWRDRPLVGHGAGSFEAWWTEHGSLSLFVRDAHSLYLETLAELGLLGFALLAAALLAGLGGALHRLRARTDEQREAAAAATAACVAFVAAAAIDWVWEVPAVTLVGVICLALALSVAGEGSPRRWDGIARVAVICVSLGLVAAQGVPLLADTETRESRAAAARDDVGAALAHADRATTIQSWAPDPWLQLALVREQAGELVPARDAIRRATAADPRDWRLWLVAARLETKLGQIDEGRRSLRRAIQLNPRSPLFRNLR